jgi:hypothetical protein
MKRLLAALLVAAFGNGCTSYRGEAIEGWVTDATTQRPLEGVIVVIQWPLERGGIHAGIDARLFARETVTDNAGHYSFPKWGPLRPANGYLSGLAPYLAFFKPGYQPFQTYEDFYPGKPIPQVRGSTLNRKTIGLKPLAAGLDEAISVRDLLTPLFQSSFGVCEWEQFPRLTVALLNIGDRCRSRGLNCNMPTRESLRGNKIQRCGDPEQLLKGP